MASKGGSLLTIAEVKMYIPAWPPLNPAYFIKPEVQESPPFPLNSSAKRFFYVARNGIYHLTRMLGLDKGGTVLAPDYHHGNEIYAMRAAGARIRYYPITRSLEANIDAVANLCRNTPRVLYVTHFIGWPQPLRELRAICLEKGITLVEDCALSFMSEYEGRPLGSFGDYSIFCLYKTLPLPNGGVLVSNTGVSLAKDLEVAASTRLSVAGRMTEMMLQWLRSNHEACGSKLFALKRGAGRLLSCANVHRVPVGDTGFDVSAANLTMSPICRTLILRFQYNWIKEVRRRNFRLLHERLLGSVALLKKNITDDVCPLFFPLLVRDKAKAAHALLQRGIETIEFWNSGDPELRDGGQDCEFLRRHVLEVPIHQDVSPEGVHYMADQIISLKVGLRNVDREG